VNNQAGAFEQVDLLTEEEKAVLRKEETHRWHQPLPSTSSAPCVPGRLLCRAWIKLPSTARRLVSPPWICALTASDDL
jgi:hypothetical protein